MVETVKIDPVSEIQAILEKLLESSTNHLQDIFSAPQEE
jgi:hypothetical protein